MRLSVSTVILGREAVLGTRSRKLSKHSRLSRNSSSGNAGPESIHWVSRKLARAEWMARTADEDAQTYLHECYRALTTVAYKFITSEVPERVRIGSAIIKDHYPPVAQVADVSERIEDLCDIPDEALERMKEIRDSARKMKGSDS